MENFKFRAWNIIVGRMQDFDFEFIENQKSKIQWHILKIMQWTGFLDINGKKIYSGDVIEISTGQRYFIQFINGSFVAYHGEMKDESTGKNYKWGLVSRFFELDENFKPKVVGNIYQNKDMVDIYNINI